MGTLQLKKYMMITNMKFISSITDDWCPSHHNVQLLDSCLLKKMASKNDVRTSVRPGMMVLYTVPKTHERVSVDTLALCEVIRNENGAITLDAYIEINGEFNKLDLKSGITVPHGADKTIPGVRALYYRGKYI